MAMNGRRRLLIKYQSNQYQLILIGMTVEVAIIVLVSVTIILILLFYMVTRYFNYRLRKSLENQNQIYSMVDGIEVRKDEIQEPESEDFAQSKCEEWKQKKGLDMKPVLIPLVQLNESNQMRESLSKSGENIYKRSRAQRKEALSIPILQESFRTNTSNKSFSVQKLDSFRSLNTLNQSQGSTGNKEKNETTHKYISRLISYIDQGISIIENDVTQIWKDKQNSAIKEKRKVEKKFVSRNDEHFYDTLEAYGFEFDIKGAYKYEKIVKIQKMKPLVPYSISQLKSMQSKQQIEVEEFNSLKNRLQSE